jgi:hypothetical protein
MKKGNDSVSLIYEKFNSSQIIFVVVKSLYRSIPKYINKQMN